MIQNYATPGGQVLVARNGKIVFNKAYGFLTYDSLIKVSDNTLYDIASLTKVTSTLMALMKLVDQDEIELDSTLAHYLPAYRETNKADITIRSLLAHHAGLKSYIPFWKRSLRGDFMDVFYYKTQADESSDQRSYGYHPDPVMLDSLESWIVSSGIDNPGYRYSDIGFMILHQVIESITGQSIEQFVSDHYYAPLKMSYTMFNPLNKGFEIYQIAPTEYDYYFREEQVWGNVHDRNAAIYGGIAGHAGLFSNAKDLAVLLQMVLQGGRYGGMNFFDPTTLDVFNHTYYSGNRRGLGWDKPGRSNPNISDLASATSFGHTGFTGTMIWVDPEYDLTFIFLSNRIFPDSRNTKLIRLDTRKRMQDLVYHSLLD
jgi:CubicO group peptidase (beta-lactamase class C family)